MDVERTQQRLLQEMLALNAWTRFGREHGFDSIRTIGEYQRRVSLSTYENYESAVAEIRAGALNFLTAEPVLLLEPTSGSTSMAKLIPYTASLRRQFQRGINAWIADLMTNRPAIRGGTAYWSISPCLSMPDDIDSAVPIGFDDDTEYLGPLGRGVARRTLAVPPEMSRIDDAILFQRLTLIHLLRAVDLRLISIWSPTFLSALLERLHRDIELIARSIHDGRPDFGLCRNPRRSREILSLFGRCDTPAEITRGLWPRLALISCWTDASAARPAERLQEAFPEVEFQSKGLIATEAFVSFPMVGCTGGALALTSHFFEFEPLDEQDAPPRLAHQLEAARRYRVIVTTAGGLYRYQLRDEIEVVSFHNRAPMIRFLGKSDNVSDLVGEKLSETHVLETLDIAFRTIGVAPRFAIVAPSATSPPHYCCYIQTRPGAGDESPLAKQVRDVIGTTLEAELSRNPYYRQAVALGQLGPIEVVSLDHLDRAADVVHQEQCIDRGLKAGDAKPRVLDARPFEI